MATQMQRPRLRLTQAHVKLMLDASLITSHDYELIDGDLIAKMPQNQPHSAANDNGYDTLTTLFGRGFVQHSAPIYINDSTSPEPDLAVLKQHRRTYTDNPSASECSLVVEVSDSTLSYDRTTKAALYAHAGVPEYWIVNLNARTLIVHRAPTDEGYGELRTLAETDSVTPLGHSPSVAVADMLP
ncbi:Uma2 family endonuclease [Armatimonas sp.]|uniref:Uma2 family endonuclease n=1 Tax=Armatimonas sp. TaxID=1872638 RepID=UPI0037507F70